MRAAISTLLLIAALVASSPGPALAQPTVQRVAIFYVAFESDVPAASQAIFFERLLDGLTAARFEVISGDRVTRALTAAEVTCRDSGCYPTVARTLSVGYLVTGTLSEQDKTYNIALDLINGRTGSPAASIRERCETCGLEEAAEKLELAASALRARLEALARTPARFVITSQPAGAVAELDGRPLGRTPLDIEVTDGQHRLALSRPGYQRVERTFIAVSGVADSLQLELMPEPTDFPFRTAGWVGVGVGAVALAAAIWAVSVDGDEIPCSAAQKDREGNCPYVRDTEGMAATFASVGAVGLTLGGVFLYMDARRAPSEREATTSALRLGYRRRF